MTEERIFDGREMTQSELDTIRRIIDEVNVEIIIEDGDIVIQATCDNRIVEPIARCDLRRVVAYSAGVAAQEEGETGRPCARRVVLEMRAGRFKRGGAALRGTRRV